MRKLPVLFVSLLLLVLASYAQKKDDSASNLKISVVKSTNSKPVKFAAVVLHPVDKDGRQDSGGVNLKTDMEGNTSFPGVPYGKLRIQVIAHGFQTYGEDFDINQQNQEIVIKLKPPAGQYSIYGDDKDQDKDKEKDNKNSSQN